MHAIVITDISNRHVKIVRRSVCFLEIERKMEQAIFSLFDVIL